MKAPQNLLKYSIGTAGTLALAPLAQAAMVIHDFELTPSANTNDHIRLSSFSDGADSLIFTVDGVNGASDNIRFYSGATGVYFDGEIYGGVTLQFLYISVSGRREAINLDPGDFVGPSSGSIASSFTHVASSSRTFRNGFAEAVRDFTGFVITVSGRTHYGWVEFTANADDTMTLHSIGIETSQNIPALVGVPEPANIAALFAAGAMGVAAFRRRRGIATRPEVE